MSGKTFVERVSDLCKSLDFLGPDFRFEKSSSAQFQSISGFLFSSVCGIACIVMGLFFGKEVYEKKEPIINISSAFVQYSDVYLDEFPVMFAFIASNGTSLSLETINRYMKVELFEQTMKENGVVKEITDYYGFDNCTNVKFKKYQDMVEKRLNGSQNLLCVNQQDKRLMFSNAYLALNSTNFNFVFRKCMSGSCPKDINEVIENMLITVIYPTSFVDIFNYPKPVDTYFDEATTQASNFLKRRVYMRFIYNKFTDDRGVVFNTFVPQDFVQLLSVVPDDLLYPKEGPFKDILFWLALESPKISNLFSRKYMKISDLLAILGGTINSLYIILRVLSSHYLRFIYMDFLRHTVYDVIFDEAEKNRIRNEKLDAKLAKKRLEEEKNNEFNSNSLMKENNLKGDNKKKMNFSDISNISNINDITPKENQRLDRIEHNSKFNSLVDSERGLKVNSRNQASINEDDAKPNLNINVKQLKISNFVDKDLMNQKSNRENQNENDENMDDNSHKRLDLDNKMMHKKSTTTRMDIDSISNQRSSIDFLNNYADKKDGKLEKYEGTKSEMDFKNKKFYNEMIIDTFKEERVPEGYINYLLSYIKCNSELSRIYEIRLKGIRKLMNINTYCRVITLQKEYALDEESFVDL